MRYFLEKLIFFRTFSRFDDGCLEQATFSTKYCVKALVVRQKPEALLFAYQYEVTLFGLPCVSSAVASQLESLVEFSKTADVSRDYTDPSSCNLAELIHKVYNDFLHATKMVQHYDLDVSHNDFFLRKGAIFHGIYVIQSANLNKLGSNVRFPCVIYINSGGRHDKTFICQHIEHGLSEQLCLEI